MCSISTTSNQHWTLYQHPFKLISKLSQLYLKIFNTIAMDYIGCFGSKDMFLSFTFWQCSSNSRLALRWSVSHYSNIITSSFFPHMNLSHRPVSHADSETLIIFPIGHVLVEQLYVWCALFPQLRINIGHFINTLSNSFRSFRTCI
jgi:hypothetical protein